ncbi:hypothetical protein ACTJJ7_19460, partial [Phyllobacterium sp. 22229]|uniref:hypothetical protein n=1 Tax=Phyllobacterium sp. 22229 TaxID=3453895 RepID=UPI003F850976
SASGDYVKFIDHQSAIAQLEAERDELQRELDHFTSSGIAEIAVRNPSVMDYMSHWEGRAEAAEKRVEEFEAGIKRLSDEEELLAETTDGDMFSMVSLAAKLAASERREKELAGIVQDADDRRIEQTDRATEAEASLAERDEELCKANELISAAVDDYNQELVKLHESQNERASLEYNLDEMTADRDRWQAALAECQRKKEGLREVGVVAWEHTLHKELGQTDTEISTCSQHPFGRPGKDYSDTYTITSKPLGYITRAKKETISALSKALSPFARISTEGVAKQTENYTTVRMLSDHFHTAARVLAALSPENGGENHG